MRRAGGGKEIDDLEDAIQEGMVSLSADRMKRDGEQKGTFEPVPTAEDHRCICAFDRLTHDAWPCHPRKKSKNGEKQNKHCLCEQGESFCMFYDRKKSKNGEKQNKHCLCEQGESFCMFYDRVAKIIDLWDFFATSYDYNTEANDDEIEALGFGVS
ncbi:unnamed protein product [Cylicostephanus goldi]|uniref:Uncharacterized protein n=1 Tax=Cylicostephanus goldi TaxID=71465 RepID=A0A3P7N8D4_CYLGO|nr:unnamed protein product [Cylicostephanus goldi]